LASLRIARPRDIADRKGCGKPRADAALEFRFSPRLAGSS
jgi:hypothetical protein